MRTFALLVVLLGAIGCGKSYPPPNLAAKPEGKSWRCDYSTCSRDTAGTCAAGTEGCQTTAFCFTQGSSWHCYPKMDECTFRQDLAVTMHRKTDPELSGCAEVN